MQIRGQIARILREREAARLRSLYVGDADPVEVALSEWESKSATSTFYWLSKKSGIPYDALARFDRDAGRGGDGDGLASLKIDHLRRIARTLGLPSLAALLAADDLDWHIQQAKEWRGVKNPIAKAMAKKGMNWAELARAVDLKFVPSLVKLDAGKAERVNLDRLDSLCRILELSVDTILGYEYERPT